MSATEAKSDLASVDVKRIMELLPHRPPMLLIDRIVDIVPDQSATGVRSVSVSDPMFVGHFPGHPIMPGVLLVEAMAQVGGMLLMGSVDDPENKVVYFMSLDNVKFRKPVIPGDQVRFELEMLQFRGKRCRMKGVGIVEGARVVEGEMMAQIVDR